MNLMDISLLALLLALASAKPTAAFANSLGDRSCTISSTRLGSGDYFLTVANQPASKCCERCQSIPTCQSFTHFPKKKLCRFWDNADDQGAYQAHETSYSMKLPPPPPAPPTPPLPPTPPIPPAPPTPEGTRFPYVDYLNHGYNIVKGSPLAGQGLARSGQLTSAC